MSLLLMCVRSSIIPYFLILQVNAFHPLHYFLDTYFSRTKSPILITPNLRHDSTLITLSTTSINSHLMTRMSLSTKLKPSDKNYPINGSLGEVVGSSGRIGSFLLRHGKGKYAAVPRGLSPGQLSPPGTPILVSVPASQVPYVIYNTIPERLSDLVLLTNGIPTLLIKWFKDITKERRETLSIPQLSLIDESLHSITTSVPHFAVLNKGDNPFAIQHNLTSSSLPPPPTYVHGKHASFLSNLLSSYNIQVEVVSSRQDMDIIAVRKLIWVSSMWLLCHDNITPITVESVHQKRSNDLYKLVQELLPASKSLLAQLRHIRKESNSLESSSKENIDDEVFGNIDCILEYIQSYSFSMPQAIPNKYLAIDEIDQRNCLLLKMSSDEQHLHREMLSRVTGDQSYLNNKYDHDENETLRKENTDDSDLLLQVECKAYKLTFLADKNRNNNAIHNQSHHQQYFINHAVVIGGGILGSSMAYSLLLHGIPNVTIIEKRSMKYEDNAGTETNLLDPGEASSTSWAWLNANSKSPTSYHQLNNLGMVSWRRHKLLSNLPIWCGSLIQKMSYHEDYSITSGSYYVEGPIQKDRIHDLEPYAIFSDPEQKDESHNTDIENQPSIFHFPDEGHVNPFSAVTLLRREIEKLGGKFIYDTKVQQFIRDDENRVIGVVCEHIKDSKSSISKICADVVAVAAGVGSSKKELGGLPMLDRPGFLTYVKRENLNPNVEVLSKILVDEINQAHLLERSDGVVVIGGGVLEVGGTSSTQTNTSSRSSTLNSQDFELVANKMLMQASKVVGPQLLGDKEIMDINVKQGFRPMPKDGYPVSGFIDDGVYTLVTHSGFTLGPLLADLAAIEISKNVSFSILDAYRPTRFSNSEA